MPMKKLLNKPWFVGTLALAALLLVGHSVWDGLKGNAVGRSGSAEVLAGTSAAPENETATEGNNKLSVRDALKELMIPKIVSRDPFAQRHRGEIETVVAAKVIAPALVDTLHLSALWTQGGETYSLINDRICQVGDEIGRLKIESASQDGVWVTHGKGRNFISLGGDFILKTPAAVSPF